jgi:hypothetical protein
MPMFTERTLLHQRLRAASRRDSRETARIVAEWVCIGTAGLSLLVIALSFVAVAFGNHGLAWKGFGLAGRIWAATAISGITWLWLSRWHGEAQ